MAIAMKQIMLITRNVQFAINVKRALEALGEYGVTTVAEVRNAIEQLRETPQHLVLLDTENLTVSPAIMIEMIRSRQSEIAIVLAPDRPEVHELARKYRVQGVVDLPVMARSLLPVLNNSIEAAYGALPQTQEIQPVEPVEDTITIESLVEDVLGEDTGLNYTRRRLQASLDLLNPHSQPKPIDDAMELLIEPHDESDTVRYRLVRAGNEAASTTLAWSHAEFYETPVPVKRESETIRHLAESFGAQVSGRPKLQPAKPSVESHESNETDIEDSAAFERMLNAVMDESTLLEDLTMESLFDTTRELPGTSAMDAIPAWLRETEKFIKEPSFLRENLPPLDAAEAVGETTLPSAVDESPPAPATPLEAQPERLTQEQESPPSPAAPLETQPAKLTQEQAVLSEASASEPAWAPLSSRENDPYLAQLAVTMTQMMGDLTADATVLTRSNRIVAYSGSMALEDFRAVRSVIADDWSAEDEQSRIRFIKLQSSGADYMLCSRGTVGGHTLTMIFAGGKQLREIRRQGDRMLSALADVPDNEPLADDEQERESVSADADSRQPFAFVWMVTDPAQLLGKVVAEQLVFWLEVQLNALNWRVYRLDVHQDFIYLYADVPGRASPELLARTVMERSRQIACSEDKMLPADLWADAYLVLQPGREMSERELQSFLQFARV